MRASKSLYCFRLNAYLNHSWRRIKKDFLHHFSNPRVNLLIWILVTKLAPAYYRKIDQILRPTTHYWELHSWRKSFKKEWKQLEKLPTSLKIDTALMLIIGFAVAHLWLEAVFCFASILYKLYMSRILFLSLRWCINRKLLSGDTKTSYHWTQIFSVLRVEHQQQLTSWRKISKTCRLTMMMKRIPMEMLMIWKVYCFYRINAPSESQ